jgi:glyoxylase-like metal-dependent hydrolase (beta-lactamase superfamily II)
MRPQPFGPFPGSYPVTQAGDVRFVPTPGHTPGHLSVAVTTQDVTFLLAGDASYTEELMLAEQIDGVTTDRATARRTLAQLNAFCRTTPTVYLPAHDPGTADRLANRQLAVASSTPPVLKIGATG